MPMHIYHYRVRAANEVGESEPSMPAMLRRKDGMFMSRCPTFNELKCGVAVLHCCKSIGP